MNGIVIKDFFMKPITEIRCLMNTKFRPNIQSGVACCDKTLNEYLIKNGNQVREVLSDFGKGLRIKSEVYDNNRIVNTLTDGNVIEYDRNYFGDVLIKEGNIATVSKNPNIWNELMSNIFKGF